MTAQGRLDRNAKSLILERTLYMAGGCFLVATIVLAYWEIPLPAITQYLSLALSSTLLVSAQALRRKLISYTVSAYFLLLLVSATVFLMSLVSSGFQGPVNSVLLLLPAYAALFLGIRGCVVFSLISTALLLAAYLMDSMGYLNYSVYPTQQAMDSKLIVFMFAMLGVAVASSTYEYNRRRTEAAMEEMNRELDAAHKGAEQSLQAKSQFLANISHEVRTPLNGILGMVTLLREKVDDPDVVQRLKTIEFSGESLLAMLNDVLDASKLESGKLELKKSPFNLLEQVNNVAEVFSVLAARQGVKLELKLDDSVPEYIEGDAVRLSQVLINLVSNAIKFSDGKALQLVLQAQREPDPRSEQERRYSIRIDVVDQGIGISAADQQKLFQPFSQANASTTREFGGSGLGLSICKGIMLQMGGEIWVKSEESKGSTFSISFPALSIDPSDLPDSEPAASKVSVGNGTPKPLRILVAEDNEVNRQVVEAFLNRLGYKADFVENGRLAVEFALANQYDLILMDCQMPILDGFDASLEICRQLGDSRPRIVALTAINQTAELEKCLEVGMDAIISKPLRMEKLEEILSSPGLNRSSTLQTERA